MIEMNLLTKQTLRVREQTYGSLYTLLYIKWITNKDLLDSNWEPCSMSCEAWMGGEFRGEWTHVCVWLSPFAIHLKLSQHC